MTVFGECMAAHVGSSNFTVAMRDDVIDELADALLAFRITANRYIEKYLVCVTRVSSNIGSRGFKALRNVSFKSDVQVKGSLKLSE